MCWSGDVWVASGQSNMEFAMRQAATADADLPHAGNPNIRLLIVKKQAIDFPQDDVDTTRAGRLRPQRLRRIFRLWPGTLPARSSSGEHVPVGVIDSTWGGTVAEAWTRMAALGADAALAPVFVSWGKMTEREATRCSKSKDQQRQRDEAKAAGQAGAAVSVASATEELGPGDAV